MFVRSIMVRLPIVLQNLPLSALILVIKDIYCESKLVARINLFTLSLRKSALTVVLEYN